MAMLTFKTGSLPNYEMPGDADMDNVYEVTVVATAGGTGRSMAGTRDVKVMVNNVEEPGTVTLNKAVPVVGIEVTASLSDPDGRISGLTWQWALGGNNIDDATSATYTPVEGNVGGGNTLTATASYTDGEGPDQDRRQSAASPNVERDTRNKPPAFEDQDPDMDGVQNSMATRKVEENTEANADDDAAAQDDATGDNVGDAVMATDTKANGDLETLTYSLGGTDAAMFRVRNNGQIEVAAGTMLDHETKDTYMVTVMAEDPLGVSASIDVTIMVTDMDEEPEVTGDATTDYAEDRKDAVATYTAADPEGAMTRWSLAGADAGHFMIDNGVLSFKEQPDFEDEADADTNNTYEVTVQATDETLNMGTKDVMVKVTNVDEDGTVTLSALGHQAGTKLTATLTDPDGTISNQMWQWSRSATMGGALTDITDETSASYTPTSGDTGAYLVAKATYEDAEGDGKTAMNEPPANAVQAVRTPNMAPVFPDDDAD